MFGVRENLHIALNTELILDYFTEPVEDSRAESDSSSALQSESGNPAANVSFDHDDTGDPNNMEKERPLMDDSMMVCTENYLNDDSVKELWTAVRQWRLLPVLHTRGDGGKTGPDERDD